MKREEIEHNKQMARDLAKVYVKETTNEKGDLLARLWTTPEFKEAFDYRQGYEKKGMLRKRLEAVYRHTMLGCQTFQKVYYHPDLLADDELALQGPIILGYSSVFRHFY